MHCGAVCFALGSAAILLSKERWYVMLLSMVPMWVAIGVFINNVFFEKYIIPKDFRGSVYVITDHEIGQDRKYDFCTRVYKVPNSGVLFTKFSQRQGLINRRKFYLEDDNGKLTELGELDYRNYIEKWVINPPKTEPSRDSLAVFTPDLDYDFDKERYYLAFTIGKYKDMEKWNYIPPERIDSLRKLEHNNRLYIKQN